MGIKQKISNKPMDGKKYFLGAHAIKWTTDIKFYWHVWNHVLNGGLVSQKLILDM